MLPDRPPPYRTVVFDCDSTLSAIEGICELAGERHAAELEALTAAAMDGGVPLEEVYGRRLELVRPTREDVERVGRLYVETLLPGARVVVRALQELGKRVVVVSGGLLPPVRMLAEDLGIPEVHAVDIRFEESGAYAGFEESSPLARAGGKPELLRTLGDEPAARPISLVGDGATDLEAAPWVDRFIAFGGVERRERVFREARVHCDAPDLRALLPLLLAPEEIDSLRASPELAPLLEPSP